MSVDGAHDAVLASTRSFGESVVTKREVCAPLIVRVGVAEHGPTAPELDGTATSPEPSTTAATMTLLARFTRRPPRTSDHPSCRSASPTATTAPGPYPSTRMRVGRRVPEECTNS